MSDDKSMGDIKTEVSDTSQLEREVGTRSALIGFVRCLAKRKWTVIGVALFFVFVVGAFTIIVTPQYQTMANVYVRFEKPPINFFPDVNPQVNVTGDVSQSIIASMREMVWSRDIAERIVRMYHLDKPDPPKGLRGRIQSAIQNTMTKFWKFLDKLGLIEYNPDLFRKAVDDFLDRIDGEVYEGTQLIAIYYQDSNKPRAQAICNSLAQILSHRFEEFSLQDMDSGYKFAKAELPLAKQRLVQADLAVQQYKQQAGLVSLPDQLTGAVTEMRDLESKLRDARVSRDESMQRLKEVRGQLAAQQVRVVTSEILETNPTILQLKSSLYDQERTLASQLERYTPDNVEIRKTQAQINAARSQLKQELARILQNQTTGLHPEHLTLLDRVASVEADLAGSGERITAFSEEVNRLKQVQHNLPEKDRRLSQLQRVQKSYEEVYLNIQNRLAELERLRETPISNLNVRLSDPAFLPKSSDIAFPPLLFIIIGTGPLALLFGIAAALLAEYFDNSFKSPSDVEQYLGVTVLAAVPRSRPGGRRRR